MSRPADVLDRYRVDFKSGVQQPAANALYPSREDRRHFEDVLTEALLDAKDEVAAGPLTPVLSREDLVYALDAFDFGAPVPMQDVFNWTIRQMKDGIVHVNHPRYFGLFNPAPTFPSQCADRIAAAFNPQLASAVTSPAAVAIEAHTIAAVAKRAGLPENAIGHFTSGGSEANYTAVICALTAAHSDFAIIGSRAFAGLPTFYVSRESHLAWLKIAHQAGIGREAAKLIPTDGSGRLDVEALVQAIQWDRSSGCVPFMIAATAGTTNAGMIDPLAECAGIARDEGIWFHVDAAWGGAVVASDRLRPLLSGVELGDSITIDAHKWLATTMGCGMFITARPSILSSAFHVSANFMPPSGAAIDPYVTTAQWSRRFAGLKLFLSLAAAGWEGYAHHVEKATRLAAFLAEEITARGWTILNDPALAVICMMPPEGSPSVRTIVNRVLASGRAWVSAATFEGSDVVRACVTHGETTADDVLTLVEVLSLSLRQ